MRCVPIFRLLLTLALSSYFSLAHSNTSTRYCPELLAVKDAPEPTHRGEFTFSPFTHHWSHNPHHRKVILLAIDEQLPGDRLCGISLFSNSFGQSSVYVYAGQQFNYLLGVPQLFAKVTAGIMYGYVDPYQNKVPFNYKGFNPALIPALGYTLTQHDSVQIKFLGKAALMFSYGHQF